jgi:hypothetical protein
MEDVLCWLPVPEVIITILSDRECMGNLFRSYCLLRELEGREVAVYPRREVVITLFDNTTPIT